MEIGCIFLFDSNTININMRCIEIIDMSGGLFIDDD